MQGHRVLNVLFAAVVAPLVTVSSGHAALTCQGPRAQNQASNQNYQVELDNVETWQPPGGGITFTVYGLDQQKSSVITACLRATDKASDKSSGRATDEDTLWSTSTPLEPVRIAQTTG